MVGSSITKTYVSFLRECSDILGVNPKLPQGSQDAKHVLEYVFAHIVEFKKLNQDFQDDI